MEENTQTLHFSANSATSTANSTLQGPGPLTATLTKTLTKGTRIGVVYLKVPALMPKISMVTSISIMFDDDDAGGVKFSPLTSRDARLCRWKAEFGQGEWVTPQTTRVTDHEAHDDV